MIVYILISVSLTRSSNNIDIKVTTLQVFKTYSSCLKGRIESLKKEPDLIINNCIEEKLK